MKKADAVQTDGISPDWFLPAPKGKRLLPPDLRVRPPRPATNDDGERPRLGLRYGGPPPVEGQ
jgi:hypothetical protein